MEFSTNILKDMLKYDVDISDWPTEWATHGASCLVTGGGAVGVTVCWCLQDGIMVSKETVQQNLNKTIFATDYRSVHWKKSLKLSSGILYEKYSELFTGKTKSLKDSSPQMKIIAKCLQTTSLSDIQSLFLHRNRFGECCIKLTGDL